MTRNQLTGLSVGVALVAIIGLVAWMTLSGDHDGMHDAGETPMDDATFVAGMIPHHQGAVDMAQVVLDRSTRPELRSLAEDIIAAQNAEIELMRTWQADGTVAAADAGHMDHDMMGGMSVDDVRNADDVDRAFIDAMIPHHQSAVMMAEQVKTQTDNPAITKLADGIIAAQEREIAQMREWRADWYGS